MKKDLFGFENQGIKYDLYRPRYPSNLLNKAVKNLKNHSRYLDIATGTGQILFELYKHFDQTVGVDLSQKMISVCKEKVKEQKFLKFDIRFERKNFMDYQEDQSNKFDLITIGQALHWFPISESLKKAKQLMNNDGTLGVYGYILKQIAPKAQSTGQKQKIRLLYENFYDKKVKSHFDFDRDELHTHYSCKQRYPFEQIFKKVQRTIEDVPIQMSKDSLIAYLKTFSGYNTYLQKNIDDPITILQEGLQSEKQYTCHFDYFCILCQK